MGKFQDLMDRELRIRGFAENTRTSYREKMRCFVRHFMRPPDELTAENVKQYQLYLTKDRRVAWSTFNVQIGAMKVSEELEGAPPTLTSHRAPSHRPPDEHPIDRLPGEAGAIVRYRAPCDEQSAGGAEQSGVIGPSATRVDRVPDAMSWPMDEPVAPDPTGQCCGTCVNMKARGWCQSHRFSVTPTVPACVAYEPIPAGRGAGA